MSTIVKVVHNTCNEYNLIKNNDKIAIALSGGKDSMSMLKIFSELNKNPGSNFSTVAIFIDMFNGKTKTAKLENICKKLDIPLYIFNTQNFDIIFNTRKEKNPCSLCAKMRNGQLHAKAKELGCNKVALGHHADDVIETFFLSMLYENRLSIFKPSSYLDRRDITIIRPLFKVFESELVGFHNKMKLPLVNNCCPMDKRTKRETVKNRLSDLEKTLPHSKKSILNSILSSDRYNLMDKN